MAFLTGTPQCRKLGGTSRISANTGHCVHIRGLGRGGLPSFSRKIKPVRAQDAASISQPAPVASAPAAAALPQGPGGPSPSAATDEPVQFVTGVNLLPAKNFGSLTGGQYPFMFDPVYGLPVVRDVVPYGELLRDIRLERVDQILWFPDPHNLNPLYNDGRCLVRYRDGGVKQAVVPPQDFRIPYAMEAHGVASIRLPLEPCYISSFAERDNGEGMVYAYGDDFVHPTGTRRGPPVGPPEWALLRLEEPEAKKSFINSFRDWVSAVDPRDHIGKYLEQREMAGKKPAFSDIGSNNLWVTLGPWIGCTAILLFTLVLRFQRGDLVDRINIYYYQDTEKKIKALKESRLTFLEEELPAIVQGGATLADVQKRAAQLNKSLGEKLAISETEVERTYQACKMLLAGGDLTFTEEQVQAVERKLDSQQYMERMQAMKEQGQEEQSAENAVVELSKFSTARIKKAADPKILEVKKKMREARRKLKATSKVQLTDEVIFFDDVAGNEQAKTELMEIVTFFKKPELYKKVGAKVPKGVLLIGPPGNGKTLMARAVAGEAGVSFVSCSASEFIEMYMGLGAARVRDLFQQARSLAPAIIFIDELDAVGRQRGSGEDANQERDMTVNQLLSEMDGFESENVGIVILAATNRLDVLDTALTRPGRFDRKVEVKKPDYNGRLQCLKVHLRDKPVEDNVNLEELAFQTAGMSGAAVAGLCNTAAYIASREGRENIAQGDLIAAIEQDVSTASTKTVSPIRRQRFALMEAAISATATLLPAIEPVKYTSIIPDKTAKTGHTVLWTNYGRAQTNMWTKRYLKEQLLLLLSSRAAEEIEYGPDGVSSLHQLRLNAARQVVTRMINSGFSSHPDFANIRGLGSSYYPFETPHQWVTVTGEWHMSRSEHIDVDMEMEKLLNDTYQEAKTLLQRNWELVQKLKETLLESSTLEGEKVREIVEQYGNAEDLAVRAAEKGKFL